MIQAVVENAMEQTQITKHYDPSYVNIDYPLGDVPMDRGVCTDVVIRALRAVGVDLQIRISIIDGFRISDDIWKGRGRRLRSPT